MEGSNWVFVLLLLFISLFIMFKMVRKKERFLIFIWYVVFVVVVSLMIELVLGSWEVCIFVLFFVVLYLIIYIFYRKRKFWIGKKGRYVVIFFSIDFLE